MAGIPPLKPDDPRRDSTITAAKITAVGTVAAAIIAAVVAIAISRSGSTNTLPLNPTNTVSSTAPSLAPATEASTPPNSSGSGFLYNVPQTPKSRQEAKVIVLNSKTYGDSFQLEIPGLTAETYSYALDGRWSKIDLVAESSGGFVGISISTDGTHLGGGTILSVTPYSDSFGIAGVEELTITFDNSDQFSPSAVLVAGNLYH
jgi:broad specificity polyphosphatase/5'/3'-nucleotidase SurE